MKAQKKSNNARKLGRSSVQKLPRRISSLAGPMPTNTVITRGHPRHNVTSARLGVDYLTFVVQRYDDQWMYARVNQNSFDVCSYPTVFTLDRASEMLEIWKRVVIDDAIPWDDSVKTDTLRITSYKMELEDKTLSLFENDEEIANFMRINAVSKLTDKEAKLLGLDVLKAKQKMVYDPEFHNGDKAIMNNLHKNSEVFTLDVALEKLSGK